MPFFKYKATNEFEEEVEGKIAAENENQCVLMLRNRNLIPFEIKEEFRTTLTAKHMDKDDIEMFCSQTESMLKAGIPLSNILTRNIESPNSSKGYRELNRQLLEDLVSGMSITQCFQRQKFLFNDFFVSMIRTGEAIGTLNDTFQTLHLHLKAQRELKLKILAVFRYPALVLLMTILAFFIINASVLPPLIEFVKSLKGELPMITKLLIELNSWMLNHFLKLFFILFVSLTLIIYYFTTKSGILFGSRIIMKMPIIGPLIHKIAIANYCSSLSISFKCGLPLDQAVKIIASNTGNAWFNLKVSRVNEYLNQGKPLSQSLAKTEVFDHLTLQAVEIGEQSGYLDQQLMRVAEKHKVETDYAIQALPEYIQPILMIVLSTFIGLLGFAMFSPIWSAGRYIIPSM